MLRMGLHHVLFTDYSLEDHWYLRYMNVFSFVQVFVVQWLG